MTRLHAPLQRSALALLASVAMSAAVASPLVFSGQGTGTNGDAIAAQVAFDLVQHNFSGTTSQALQVTVTNTAATSNFRGNAITGLFFAVQDSNLGALGTLTTTASGFDGLAALVRSNEAADATQVDLGPAAERSDTDGTFILNNFWSQTTTRDNNGYDWSAYDYAISTIGGGLGGFKGRDVNNDDYGIVAAGSALKSGGLNKDVWVDGSAVFWIRVLPSVTDLSFIQAVELAYGSQPDNRLATQRSSVYTPTNVSAVPEPSGWALWLGALAALGLRQWRHRRSELTR